MPRRNGDLADRISKEHSRSGGGLTATFGRGEERVVRVYRGTFKYVRSGRNSKAEIASHSITEHAAQAVADCRELGPDWRILSLSTPSTIYRDLTGRRGLVQMPEPQLVARADHDVLAPHLVGRSEKSERQFREATS